MSANGTKRTYPLAKATTLELALPSFLQSTLSP